MFFFFKKRVKYKIKNDMIQNRIKFKKVNVKKFNVK